MAESPSSMEGEVGFAIQSVKGTAASAYYNAKLTRFRWTPDVVTDEGEPEIGGDLDVGLAERFGHKGATVEGEGRFRPAHLGLLLRGYGMQHQSGGLIFWDGVNDQIKITDDGGTVTLDIITDGGLVAGTVYTPDQVATAIAAMATANGTLSGTYVASYSTTTLKFTIGVSRGSAALTLVWSDSHLTQQLADLLGYATTDDSGSTSYASDEARDYTGRWSFRDARNDTIRVTDAGGGPVDVDILSSTGYKLTARVPYNAWNVCGALKAVLDANTTLSGTYTVTYSVATHKFTIAATGGTLSLFWSHSNSNLEDDLGYAVGADDTGNTSYTADYTIWPAARHLFTPYAASSSFPWLSCLDSFDSAATLNTKIKDLRISKLTIVAEPDSPVRLQFSGRALYYADASGAETETDDGVTVGTPNTCDGQVNYGSTDDYPLASLNFETSWDEEVEPALGTGQPRSVVPRRRTTGATAKVYFGSESGAGVFRSVFYGSSVGTAPSNTIVSRALDALFLSGTAVSGVMAPGQSSATADYYGIRIEAPEAQMMSYGLEKSGDALVAADLAVHITRESTDWGITLINGEDRTLYA